MKLAKFLVITAAFQVCKETLDPFVIRRGYTLSSKTWKNMGVG
jgi:hypothetical protein